MREIVFRGKTEAGNWVVGMGIAIGKQGVRIHYSDHVNVQVIPETVGQYTGLVDKNGEQIFEGDIVSICGCTSFLFVINWDDRKNCYVLKGTVNGVQDAAHNVIGSPEDVEVVGNIYDNPELLKDGALNDD